MNEQVMNCPLSSEDNIDVLLDYSAGKLDRQRCALLEQHKAVCEECRSFLAEQSGLWLSLDAWEPEPISLDFNRRLWQRIDAVAASPWYRKFIDSLRMGAWKPALPLTAAVVLVAAGFMMDHQTMPQNPAAESSVSSSQVSATEAEQVEKTLEDIQLLRQLDSSASTDSPSKPM